jgi:hypothetical protein
MLNLVELISDDEEMEQSPCKHGNIVTGHACYCHSEAPKAPRKCPIWRMGNEWNITNCQFFEPSAEQP